MPWGVAAKPRRVGLHRSVLAAPWTGHPTRSTVHRASVSTGYREQNTGNDGHKRSGGEDRRSIDYPRRCPPGWLTENRRAN